MGELITVEKDSLLLLSAEINADVSERVLIKEVKTITIVKKSRGFQVGIYGVLAGVLYGSINRPAYRYEDKSQSFWMTGVIGGVAGIALGTVLGINKRIQIQVLPSLTVVTKPKSTQISLLEPEFSKT